MIVTNENLDQVLECIAKSKAVSLDTETTGLRPYHGDDLFSIVVGTELDTFYFNFKQYEDVKPLHKNRVMDIYDVVKGKKIYFANAKFDMHFLCKNNWEVDYSIWDILVVDKCIYNRHLLYNLDAVAERMGFGKKQDVLTYIKDNKLFDKSEIPGKKSLKKNPRFDLVPFNIISEYAIRDADLTLKIGLAQEKIVDELTDKYSKIKGYPTTFRKLIDEENKLTKVLFDIEKRGMELDRDYIEKAKTREQARIDKAKAQFKELTGREFVDSNKQISEVFKSNGIVGGTTAKGNASFTDAVLEKIDHPISKLITEYRDAYKRLNTYYNSFTYHADKDGIIRPSIKQTAADTFRFSIVDPALQTLNSEDDGEWRVRDSFKARDGFILCSIDFAAQEYRLTADYAGECDLISQIKSGVDVHTATSKMMGIDRHSAKVLNFALLYGAQSQKISEMLQITVPKATELRNLYFSRLGKVSSFIHNVKNAIDRRGFIFNFAGRILHFPTIEFMVADEKRKGNFSYKGPNYIIQSSGSEIMRRSLIVIHSLLSTYKSKLVLSVHDEVLLEMSEDELHLIPRIRELMVSVYTPKNGLPMSTSVAIGESWGRLEDIDEAELTKRIDIQKKSGVETEEIKEHRDFHNPANVDSGDSRFVSLL